MQTLEELRDYFTSIPETKWCKGVVTDLHDATRHCALGWLMVYYGGEDVWGWDDTVKVNAGETACKLFGSPTMLVKANDGELYDNVHLTPKQAVMRLINECIASQSNSVEFTEEFTLTIREVEAV